MLVRITSKHFCAGLDLNTRDAAPIIAYMRNWSLDKIQSYCKSKGWKMEIVKMLDLANPQHREDLAEQIQIDIDDYCKTLYGNDHRNHLGASQLADECWRKLWYVFRWVQKPDYDGRMLRLFNVGHMAEPRFIQYLRGIGFEVKEFAEDGNQWRIIGANGHYGGSLDGICKPPSHYLIQDDLVFLNEFKTNGTGTGYSKVAEEDLAKAKPMHWGQMCQYGYKYNLRYGLYLIENKNDSGLTVKIVELDWRYGATLEKKAEEIVAAKEPPNKISENPAFFNCKMCDFREICHFAKVPEKNCRSCRNATPVENGQWHCSRWNSVIPTVDDIKNACDEWLAI